MEEPHYHIEENDHGQNEARMPGAKAPVTIKETLDEAVAWIKRTESAGAHCDDE